MDQEKKTKLQFNIKFDGKPSEEINLALYAFDGKGACIAISPVKNGQATLSVSEGAVRRTRVLFAPVMEKERTAKITIAMLERLCAYEPAWRFHREKPVIEVPPIPHFHWKCWPFCICRIRGKVVRPVTVGDQTADRPVCHARVHICEADPFFLLIPRLPDPIIFRIRDELLAAIERPIPFPPDPDPGPLDPADIMPGAAIHAATGTRDFAYAVKTRAAAVSQINPQPEPSAAQPLANLLSAETKLAFRSPSAAVVRQSILDNILVIKPFWCHWPWIWPFFVRCDEIDVVETDGQGLFDSVMIYRCRGDHPDLYFWVEYNIGGVWTKVYRPRFPCHIHWNYPCGSLVTIRITDPRVPWCEEVPQVPAKVLAITHIGKNVSMCEIIGSTGAATEGMTNSDDYFGTTLKPFGGSLEPNVLFGPDLLSDGITHYRWSYRRCGYADGTDIPAAARGDWYIMDAPVLRSYTEVRNNPPEYTMITKHVTLGPDPVVPQTLFRIHIGDYTLDPPPDYTNPAYYWVQWTPASDVRQNSASAFFLSHLLEGGGPAGALAAAGKYELKLELFRVDPTTHAATQVDFTADNVIIKTPLIPAPFGWDEVNYRTVPHQDDYDDQEDRVIRDPGTSHIMAFRLVLFIDNNPCAAEIYPVQTGSGVAGPCGFLQYPTPLTALSPEATLRFRASHPNNRARFVFELTRGSTGCIADACVPSVPSAWNTLPCPLVSDLPASTNGFGRDPATGIFSKNIPVSTLLGTCPNGKASFAENLSVYALAYDGWSRLYYVAGIGYLDAWGVPASFALEPEPPAPGP